jgi:tetratricopeptide (TPR) repeat protein
MAYAESLYALARFSIAQSKYQDAEEFLKQVLDELKKPLDDRGVRLEKRRRYMLATILAHLHGKFGEAEQMIRQILSSPFNRGDIRRRHVLSQLAHVLKKQHRHDEAEQILTDLLNGPKLLLGAAPCVFKQKPWSSIAATGKVCRSGSRGPKCERRRACSRSC